MKKLIQIEVIKRQEAQSNVLIAELGALCREQKNTLRQGETNPLLDGCDKPRSEIATPKPEFLQMPKYQLTKCTLWSNCLYALV